MGYLPEALGGLCLSLHGLSSGFNSGLAGQSRSPRAQGLLVLGQHVVEDVEEDMHMVLLENQRWTETDGSVPTPSQEDTFVSGFEQEAVASGVVTDIDGAEGPLPPSAAQYARVSSLKIIKTVEQGFPRTGHLLQKALSANHIENLTQEQVL